MSNIILESCLRLSSRRRAQYLYDLIGAGADPAGTADDGAGAPSTLMILFVAFSVHALTKLLPHWESINSGTRPNIHVSLKSRGPAVPHNRRQTARRDQWTTAHQRHLQPSTLLVMAKRLGYSTILIHIRYLQESQHIQWLKALLVLCTRRLRQVRNQLRL